MPVVVSTNIGSLVAQKSLNASQNLLQRSFQRLSSGFRVNSAKDDAAGLAVSTRLNAQIRSNTVAERNASDGISMAQIGEGALGSMADILTRMRELAVQSANGSYANADRGYLHTEFISLQKEIKRISSSTRYAGTKIVGTAPAPVTFQVGTESTGENQIVLSMGSVSTQSVVSIAVKISAAGGALAAIGVIDSALDLVAVVRSRFGAVMNRLEITTGNLATERLNLSAARSRIVDVDVADEAAAMSRNQVLVQASTSILAQANQSPMNAMNLLR